MIPFLLSVLPLSLAETPVSADLKWIPRSAWGAKPQKGACKPHKIKKLSVHHTATHNLKNAKSPRNLRSYQRFHQKQGWPDLAYHFFIDLKGNLYEGRSLDCAGDTFTKYDPSGHFLVVLEGNFQKQKPTSEATNTLINVLAWAAVEYGVSPDTLQGHRDLAATACPGDHLYHYLESGELKTKVKARMGTGLKAGPEGHEAASKRLKRILKPLN